MKKVTAFILSICLTTQAMAFGDRTEGIGEQAIINAQARAQELKGRLQAVSTSLLNLENQIQSGKPSRGALISSVSAILAAGAFGAYYLQLEQIGKKSFNRAMIFGAVSLVSTLVSSISTFVNNGDTGMVQIDATLKKDLSSMIETAQLVAQGESDPEQRAIAEKVLLALTAVSSSVSNQQTEDLRVRNGMLIMASAQATSILIAAIAFLPAVGKGAQTFAQAGIVLSGLTSFIVAIGSNVSDRNNAILLKEVSKARQSITALAAGL